jgi:hypothetical protein
MPNNPNPFVQSMMSKDKSGFLKKVGQKMKKKSRPRSRKPSDKMGKTY